MYVGFELASFRPRKLSRFALTVHDVVFQQPIIRSLYNTSSVKRKESKYEGVQYIMGLSGVFISVTVHRSLT